MSQDSTIQIEQPAVAETRENGPPIGFFAIGVMLNVALITAFVIWAYRNWKNSARRDD